VEKLLTPSWQGKLKHPRGKDKVCGIVTSFAPKIVEKPTFMEYVQGGLQIGLCVAIDYTASNGEPSNPASLHLQAPGAATSGALNAYEQAITAVGAVLAPYDADGMFACYGYGAALPPNYIVSHCFALNGTPATPHCQGVEGILAAYRKALGAVRLSGPTCFAPVIKAACDAAEADVRATPAGQLIKYTVLLIITDGVIMDMEETSAPAACLARLRA
jgi:hypothetical protein